MLICNALQCPIPHSLDLSKETLLGRTEGDYLLSESELAIKAI